MQVTALHEQLRAGTVEAHSRAEQSTFLAELVEGRLAQWGLAQYLGRLLPVYEALEAQARTWTGDLAGFHQPELERTAALQHDLSVLGGRATVTPAVAAYVQRIKGADGVRALAHHYTRYLGDLSGGQVMRVALERSLGLTAGEGASFFAFPGLVPGHVKAAYRERLDSVAWSADDRAALLEEVLVAYELNRALLAELDAEIAA